MRLRIAATACSALLLSYAPVAAAPIDAIRAGSMEEMIPEIIALYEDAGLSWRHTIDWQIGPFTTTYWYYSFATDELAVGAVPRDDEIETYWQTWSDVLTDSQFEPDAFFASVDEARELAHFNQFVLATHESAHAMTYRYDWQHLDRHDDPGVNCREYHADRLTISILNELAGGEPDIKRWRDRYLELVVAMGDTIPEQYRYHIADYATLDANCAIIDVAQPTPETMQPYASAYFERYRVLLEADLPPMATLFATHLQARHDAKYADDPLTPEYDSVTVTTLSELSDVRFGDWSSEDYNTQYSTAAGFDPDGKLWFATVTHDTTSSLVSMSFGDKPDGTSIEQPTTWEFPSKHLSITSVAVLSPSYFFFTLDHWDEGGTDGAERQYISYGYAKETVGKWEVSRFLDIEGAGQGAVRRTPKGRVFLFGTPDTPRGDPSTNWGGLEISTEAFEVVSELPINQPLEFPLAIDEAGRVYQEVYSRLWRTSPDELAVLTGDALGAPVDGVGKRAGIWSIDAMQWTSDNRALFVDDNQTLSGNLIREIVTK